MLLIDGVKYHEWTPPNEDTLEQMVIEHAQDIFGENSVYLDLKPRLKSRSGIASIPDGYVVKFGESPQWHIVEVELSSHPLFEHIVSQVSKFFSGIKNPSTQRDIAEAIHDYITSDDILKIKTKKQIEPLEIYRFLLDLISKTPTLTVIIEKNTEGLKEALNTLAYSQNKVIEFQTFIRASAENVHAHLFVPLYTVTTSSKHDEGETKAGITEPVRTRKRGRKVVISPTGEILSLTKFAERFATEAERNVSLTTKNWPHVLVDSKKKYDAFIAKHPECAGWTYQDNK